MLPFFVPLLFATGGGAKKADFSVPDRFKGHIVSARPKGFSEKVVALTFDDGPDPKVTPSILYTLAKYDAKATFFELGQCVKAYPKLTRSVVGAGHVVGSHSYSHPARPPKDKAQQEIDKTSEAIKAAIGVRPTIFRPTFGITNNWLTKVATSEKYVAVTWTLTGADTAARKPADISNNVDNGIQPGSIVLMHDGAGHHMTTQALPTILAHLKKEGYEFVTVPEMLKRWDNFYNVQTTSLKPKKVHSSISARRKLG